MPPVSRELVKRLHAEVEGLTEAEANQLDRILQRRKQTLKENIQGRGQPRVDRIAENYERIKAKIAANPDDPRVSAWKKRLEEYETSLQNWDKFKQETEPTGTPGVEINVPLGRLGIGGKNSAVETD